VSAVQKKEKMEEQIKQQLILQSWLGMSGIFIKWNLRDGGGETRGGWVAAVASHFRRLLRGRNDVYCGEPLKGISFKKWTVGLFDCMESSFGTCAKKTQRRTALL
jgi:hypothetical protein